MSIPKKIHYCWLGTGKMPENAMICIATWKKVMPDYELVLWDTNRFDINSVKYVQEAFTAKKWALAADYIRLYAVYNEGGIYLDTDVYVQKRFDDLLKFNFFTSLERDLTTVPPSSNYYNAFKQNENAGYINHEMKRYEGFGLQAAVFGSVAGNQFIKDCMEWYERNNYILPNGEPLESIVIAPDIYAAIAQSYGFKYISGFQQLKDNMVIMPADVFPNHIYKTDNAYAVHLCENSWVKNKKQAGKNSFLDKIKQNNILRALLGKKKHYHWETVIKLG
ncbi:MAG: hypothetical protein LBH43_21535, partial [Treponema sp.]|nr:hypothetical protein [Treponema sp.]